MKKSFIFKLVFLIGLIVVLLRTCAAMSVVPAIKGVVDDCKGFAKEICKEAAPFAENFAKSAFLKNRQLLQGIVRCAKGNKRLAAFKALLSLPGSAVELYGAGLYCKQGLKALSTIQDYREVDPLQLPVQLEDNISAAEQWLCESEQVNCEPVTQKPVLKKELFIQDESSELEPCIFHFDNDEDFKTFFEDVEPVLLDEFILDDNTVTLYECCKEGEFCFVYVWNQVENKEAPRAIS